ncbi:MAG: tol-pal system protein YbgF [Phenylobacterium sp.]|uniref:tol-pal system protein YbgF n=1 Tax=Phenylobacterium sp. TaxID=1871053 RepID=UPI00273455F5|nr:tol-pal system protein YbgF [Phenylobacterium sp.]MDP3175941.1 tol-pal system protein YbgF [Phenylobacterium sp.]
MPLRRLLIPAAFVLLTLSPSLGLAQTPMDDPLDARDARRVERMEKVVRELRAIVFQARDTGRPVVVQPAETDYQMQELTRRVGDLEQTLTRINGALDSTSHELQQSRAATQALEAQNRALADRLSAAEQRAVAPPEGVPAPVAGGPAAPTAAEAFTRARQQMLGGDYDGAEVAWRNYVANYADSPKTPEAHYWLGKTLAVRAAHADAAAAFIGAIRGWPQTSWAPDAVVELSRALIGLKKPTDACQTLAELTRHYPKAPPAVLARAQAARAQAKCAA